MIQFNQLKILRHSHVDVFGSKVRRLALWIIRLILTFHDCTCSFRVLIFSNFLDHASHSVNTSCELKTESSVCLNIKVSNTNWVAVWVRNWWKNICSHYHKKSGVENENINKPWVPREFPVDLRVSGI